jgi:translation initiation factor RLI1
LVGLTYFLTEQVPYQDVKTQLKYALALAARTSHTQLTAVVLHNLAVVNHCELTDHNERVLSGVSLEDEAALIGQIE